MGLFSSIGSALNSITGASNSASQSYKYSSALQAQNWEYQKEAMQNAHQWEVQDLIAAGLNPALSADGGSGASTGGMNAGTGGIGGQMGDAGGMLTAISQFGNLANSTKATNAQVSALNAETSKKIAENRYIDDNMKSAILNTIADTDLKRSMLSNSAMDTQLKKAQRKYNEQMTATSAQEEKVLKMEALLKKAMESNTQKDTELKGAQVRNTYRDAEVKTEEKFLKRSQTQRERIETDKTRYGKLANKFGTELAEFIIEGLLNKHSRKDKRKAIEALDAYLMDTD